MITKFYDALRLANQNAKNFINKSLPANGVSFINEDDDINDCELAIVSIVDKHGYYEEYAIHKLSRNERRDVIVHGTGKGDLGGTREFELEEIDADNTCFLADLLTEKLS